MDVSRWLHVTGVVIWVGGMFFAYMALRPVAAELLEGPQRLRLWRGVFQRFFLWVWTSVIAILLTGLHMLFALGGHKAPLYTLLMTVVGIIMMLIYGHVYFAPYRRLRRAVDAQEWPAGAASLGQIRRLVGLNLILGLVTITLATAGRLIG